MMILSRESRIESIKHFLLKGETVCVFLVMVFVIAVFCSLFLSPNLYQWKIIEGDIALKNVYAPYDFSYYWGIDQQATEKARKEAEMKAPVVLVRDRDIEVTVLKNVRDLFDAVSSARAKNISAGAKVDSLKAVVPGKLSARNIRDLVETGDLSEVEKNINTVINRLFIAGLIKEEDKESLLKNARYNVLIVNGKDGTKTERATENLIGTGEIENRTNAILQDVHRTDKKTEALVSSVVRALVLPSLSEDQKRTDHIKKNIVAKTAPIYKKWSVEKNELIIEKGKRIDSRHIAQITQLRRFFRPGMTPKFFIGVVLLFGLLGVMMFFYAKLNHIEEVGHTTKSVAIILVSMFLTVVISDFIMHSPQPTYFIPMASMGMMITLLVSPVAAFICVVAMCFLISLLVGGGIEVMLVLFAGSVTGMYFVKNVRRRAQILLAGLLVGIAKFLAMMCIGFINSMDINYFFQDGAWCFVSGIFSGFVVMALLPLYEYVFKAPTNISLLELSDLNHPLLKKLAIEAPGTYHHSIMVGNIAESACDAIGANSLKARVGAYYHDIGKIAKAEYFSENEMGGGSRHHNLSPSMSALIISKHVKDGLELARKYKFNSAIMDFIGQHHGDSLISFFYQKALEGAKNGTEVKEENFRYPGPKPQTKESAIVLLADSVEASSRTLETPTPASVRNLVIKIINNKFIDGQLDECDLTLRDMHNIADSFVRVLMGIFHTRLDYPDKKKKESGGKIFDENKHKKPKQKKKD